MSEFNYVAGLGVVHDVNEFGSGGDDGDSRLWSDGDFGASAAAAAAPRSAGRRRWFWEEEFGLHDVFSEWPDVVVRRTEDLISIVDSSSRRTTSTIITASNSSGMGSPVSTQAADLAG